LGIKEIFNRLKIFFNNYFLKKDKINLKMPKPIIKKDIHNKLISVFNNNQYSVRSLGGETFEINY
tara:strand:- start:1255 stop:1449 length:195 start_codon:yes stop_codon:yes gene_type:complete